MNIFYILYIDCIYYIYIVCKRQYVETLKKMSFLFISLPWLSNELLWSINKLKQGLWCTIWLSYKYIYIYIYINIYIYIYSILHFLTPTSEIGLGYISFFVLLFRAQAAEVQEGSLYPWVFLYLFWQRQGIIWLLHQQVNIFPSAWQATHSSIKLLTVMEAIIL